MSLDTQEFIRRFLLHVLPKRFIKIRHYGFLSNRNRHKKLRLCQRLTHSKIRKAVPKLSSIELLKKLTGIDLTVCPFCGKGHMLRRLSIPRSPPSVTIYGFKTRLFIVNNTAVSFNSVFPILTQPSVYCDFDHYGSMSLFFPAQARKHSYVLSDVPPPQFEGH